MLWDGLRGTECPPEASDRPRRFWPSSLLRETGRPPDVRVKKYKILPEISLLDPFDSVELNAVTNKDVKSSEQPPNLFPAFTTSAPPAEDELRYSGTQRGAVAVQEAGKEEIYKLREAMERQVKLIENLTEQQPMIAQQMHTQ